VSKPLVSVIVTSRNNADTITNCLASIRAQTYQSIELIVVDNNSRDETPVIARRYADKVYNLGPERSAQRNFGAAQATGDYLFIIDSDMRLEPRVVEACVTAVQDPAVQAVIVPEHSIGDGFWAKCKSLERSFYVGQDTIEAARFFGRNIFEQAGKYSEEMTGGEDWDLSRRIAQLTRIGRVDEFILHDEGRLYFGKTLKKMYYYAGNAVAYFAKNPTTSALTDQSGPLARYKLFFSRPGKLFARPLVGLGMLTLKTGEYAAGGLGYIKAKYIVGSPRA